MKYTNMYPKKNDKGNWVVVRILANKYTLITPWSYTRRDGAVKFCEANGFKVG